MLGAVLIAALAAVPVGETAAVERVIDGDSILVKPRDGERREVRYIGINAPEWDAPCGAAATAANAAMVDGQTVMLVPDVVRDRDKYGRLLRYVFVGNTFVNAALVARGYAVARNYEPRPLRYTATLAALEQAARAAHRGCLHPRLIFLFPSNPSPTLALRGVVTAFRLNEMTAGHFVMDVLTAVHPAWGQPQ